MAISNEQLGEKLNDLIQLDFDAIEAYQAAIERLESADCRQHLETFMRDHERHTVNLAEQVSLLGGTPKTKGDFMAVLTKGKVVIGQIAEDKGILMAMNANETVTNKTYEKVLADIGGHAAAEAVVRGNLADERRHKAWIEQKLEEMKQGDDLHARDRDQRPGESARGSW